MKSKLLRYGLGCAAFGGALHGLVLGVVAAAPAAPAAAAPAAASPAPRISEGTDRRGVSITVYNSNFGLVREVRKLSGLPKGQGALEFRDVASTIQPETVAVKPLEGARVRVLEQN